MGAAVPLWDCVEEIREFCESQDLEYIAHRNERHQDTYVHREFSNTNTRIQRMNMMLESVGDTLSEEELGHLTQVRDGFQKVFGKTDDAACVDDHDTMSALEVARLFFDTLNNVEKMYSSSQKQAKATSKFKRARTVANIAAVASSSSAPAAPTAGPGTPPLALQTAHPLPSGAVSETAPSTSCRDVDSSSDTDSD